MKCEFIYLSNGEIAMMSDAYIFWETSDVHIQAHEK